MGPVARPEKPLPQNRLACHFICLAAGGETTFGLVRVFRSALAIVSSLSLLGTLGAGAQVTLVYSQKTGPKVDRIEISERAQGSGSILAAVMTSGESYLVQSDPGGGVTACRFEFPPDGTSWNARRDGRSLHIEGLVRGRWVSRTFAIDDNPWYESAEWSLQDFALSDASGSIEFWLIEPYGGNAYLMEGHIDAHERIVVNGTNEDAVRIVVRPAGFFSFLWSSTYWYSPRDGTFLKSEAVRAFFSIGPLTTIELPENHRGK